MRREPRGHATRRGRSRDGGRRADAGDSSGAASSASVSRPGLPFSELRSAIRPGSPHPALGQWRPHHAVEPRAALSLAPPGGPRRRLSDGATARWRAALLAPRRPALARPAVARYGAGRSRPRATSAACCAGAARWPADGDAGLAGRALGRWLRDRRPASARRIASAIGDSPTRGGRQPARSRSSKAAEACSEPRSPPRFPATGTRSGHCAPRSLHTQTFGRPPTAAARCPTASGPAAGGRLNRAAGCYSRARRPNAVSSTEGDSMMSSRPHTPAIVLALLLFAAAVVVPPAPAPAADDVKIALVAPLSGRWARQGQLKKMGAEMAIEEINGQGGIKALGGAKIVLREADAGDSVEKAVSAAQRILTREKISAGIGSWLSSFTLGVTELAERLQVPWLSLSYADSITERGFKYTFQTSPVSSAQAEQALDLVVELARRNNQPIRKAALIGDNTAATVFFFKPLREKLLQAKGIELVVDEVWTPPLPDATSIVQKLRATQPDLVFYGATNFPDSIQVLQKVKEFGVKTHIQGVGAWLVTPEYVKTVGKELLDNIQTVVAAHPLKGQEELVKKFVQRTGEPFMTQDPLVTYAHVWLIKEAAEQAKSADPKAIRDALAKIDLTTGPAASTLSPGRIRFDERGRRIGAVPLIVQWQNGGPFTAVPVNLATRPVVWHK